MPGVISDRGLAICRQADEAFAKKGSLNNFWQETALNFFPERATFAGDRSLGEDMASSLYASEPILNRRDFGNWMGAVLRPKGREWFLPRARNDEINDMPDVKEWLEARGKVTRSLIYDNKSQFVRSQTSADHDYVTFGNAVCSLEERQDKTGLRFRSWHLKDCAWRENYDGDIDTTFRRFKMSAMNLCSKEREGWMINEKVKKKLQKEPNFIVNCLHVMMPVWDYDYTIKVDAKGGPGALAWVSAYFDMDNKHEMSFKRVPEFSYIISRWFTVSGSPYAFSPCVIAALPDARTLQAMTWSILEAGEKAVEPPTIAVAEAIIGGVDLRAGYTTWVDSRYDERTGEALRPVQLGETPQFGEVLRQGLTATLQQAWYLNKLFLPQNNVPMTAEEASLRNAEFLRATQPIIDPAESERNGITLDLTIQMSMRLGYWGDLKSMPQALQGEHVDVTYDNPVEDARKQSKADAYRATLGLVGLTKQVGDASVVANFDNNKGFRDAMLAAPPSWLLKEDEGTAAVKAAQHEADVNTGMQQAAGVAHIAGSMNGKTGGSAKLPVVSPSMLEPPQAAGGPLNLRQHR